MLAADCWLILMLDKNCGEENFDAFLSYSVSFATNGLPIPPSFQVQVCVISRR